VIRFDNRDCGRSARIECDPTPKFADLMSAYFGHVREWRGYTLDDMADDASALLDHLGVAGAHVIGASLGG
jgi:pimeloyl-ACP methyl ester carboxylesterase